MNTDTITRIKCCENCKWWDSELKVLNDHQGFCCRHSPTAYWNSSDGVTHTILPVTSTSVFCGEFEGKGNE